MRLFFIIWFLGESLCGLAGNLRIQTRTRLVDITDQVATLEFTLSWDNSWRNVYNHDAVYIFGKYRTVDSYEWYPLKPALSGHSVLETGYAFQAVNTGIFVFRAAQGEGEARLTLHLCWQLDDNPVTAEALRNGKILYEIQGIEMVYIPTAPFYAGDGVSEHGFSSSFGAIPARYDIIGMNSNYAYTASGGTNVAKAADRVNNALNINNCWYNATAPSWWQVDFKSEKTILYFGVSSLWQGDAYPGGVWSLQGSKDGVNWMPVWEGGPEEWSCSRISYPVQRAIRVTQPGSYRYYRITIPSVSAIRAPFYKDVRIANVAMTTEDLSVLSSEGITVDGGTEDLPETYPSGYKGFFVMKYELTQEQYVNFLNKLPYSGQYTRTIGGALDGLNPGDYVFGGDVHSSSRRNGIVLVARGEESGTPAVFGCNLQPADCINGLEDGQTVACNYLSVADMLAYADWCGLRPLSELEYEKMCRCPDARGVSDAVYAWGKEAAEAGRNLKEGGKETEYFSSGNANLRNEGLGPVRSGSFVKEGRNRKKAGIGFWGVEDLSGNLAEIYYNAEVYGKQLDRSVHGSGTVDEFGRTTVSALFWPEDLRAVGVRGGNFADTEEALRVSDRRYALGDYFQSMDERKSEVGFRLGYSIEPTVIECQLTLENGRRSGSAAVYDTVCDNHEYRIQGDEITDAGEPSTYSWYVSDDNIEWKLLKEENRKDLLVSDLTGGMQMHSTKWRYYKRYAATPSGIAKTGVVGLCIGYGYTIDRLRDTLIPCMKTPGFTVHTPLPAKFGWYSVETDCSLKADRETAVSSHYDVAVADFRKEDGKQPAELYYLEVTITMANRCVTKQKLEVWAENHTRNPYPDIRENFTFNAQGKYEVTHKWSGKDQWSWEVESRISAIGIAREEGILTGKTDTLDPYIEVGLVCNDCPDKVWKKYMKEERTLTYVGNYQTLFFLSGSYRLECWGGAGGYGLGSGSPAYRGGYGGYTRGDICIENERPFYIYVGSRGLNGVYHNIAAASWNGGGRGDWDHSDDESGAAGGGATDVRLVSGAWNDFGSLKSRIMVAAGGGGGAEANGAAGGGLNGYASPYSTGGTQTSGYSFGRGCDAVYRHTNVTVGGGGGGYYGGYANSSGAAYTYGASGAGGSSFISGHNGCNAIKATSTASSIVHTGNPYHYSGFYFTDTKLIDGGGYSWTNVKGSSTGMPSPTAAGNITGNTGNGYFRVKAN